MAGIWTRAAMRVSFTAFFLFLPLSCTTLSSARSIEEVKAGLSCVDDSGDLRWEQVEKQLGRPDEAPIPAPGSLFRNARVYKDKVVIFHVDTKETVQAGRSTFVEVVKKIEVCKEK